MAPRFKNRLLAMSLALAAAGILTCVACLIDVFIPRGSVAAFLGVLLTASIAVAAVMISFAWSCEKLERGGQLGPRYSTLYGSKSCSGDWPRAVTSARGGRPAVLLDSKPKPSELPASRRGMNYPLSLRGAISHSAWRMAHLGRGQ